jgi:hypothetical protein
VSRHQHWRFFGHGIGIDGKFIELEWLAPALSGRVWRGTVAHPTLIEVERIML